MWILIVGTLLTWIVTFLVAIIPGRYVGAYIARDGTRPIAAAVLSIMATKLALIMILLCLMLLRLEALPHLNADPKGFGMVFVGILFFVPIFAAVMRGYLRARANAAARGPDLSRVVKRRV